MAEKRDYYEILEVARDANGDTIKKSYRKLAVKFHPDKNLGDPTAEDKFKELGEAYEALSDPDKRAAYDRYGHAAFNGGGGGRPSGGGFHDPMDLFSQVFGGGFGGGFEEFFGGGGGGSRRNSGKQKGSDLRYELEISLEEAARGIEKELEIERYVACEPRVRRAAAASKPAQLAAGAASSLAKPAFLSNKQPAPNAVAPVKPFLIHAPPARAMAASSANAASNYASPPASIPAPVCAPLAMAMAASAAVQRAISTSFFTSAITTCSSATTRTCSAPCLYLFRSQHLEGNSRSLLSMVSHR